MPRPRLSSGDLRRCLLRFLLVLAAGLLVKWAGGWSQDVPVVSLLAHTSLLYVTASILFGWAGLAAAFCAHAAYLAGADSLLSVTEHLAYLASGALAWLVFRHVPRVSRSLRDLRSFAFYVLASGVGGVLTPAVISLGYVQNHDLFSSIALWSRSTVVTLWVFGPPVLILGMRYLRRCLAAVPGEPAAEPARRLDVRRREAVEADGALRITEVESREVPFERSALGALAIVVVVTVVKLVALDGWGPAVAWWNLLYLAPVYWLAERLWLPGGLLAAGFVGFVSLAGDAYLAPAGDMTPQAAVGVYAQLLLFWFVGALLGRAAAREGGLLEELAESHQRIREDLRRVVGALTGALEAKDEYTEGHLHRVNQYALSVGRRLGLRGRDLELLQIAGTLHDMGKIAIPEAILTKNGPLDDDENEIMRRHPEIGARILAGIDGLEGAAPLVLHHHERWDGRTDGRYPGYPSGLSGDEIPLGSRIISVVDTFDAMTTDRPYRLGLGAERARQELLDERGKQFDPQVVDCFLELIGERPWETAC